jgi:hypothetical protein
MPTINDIMHDNNLYSQVNDLVLMLYQAFESPMDIPLSNTHLMTFIQAFDDISHCQNHITTNDRNTFTLFAYSGNIQTWLWNNNIIPNNLDDIIIFCAHQKDQQFVKAWTRRYTQKIRDVILCDELERELLLFGMKYIKKIRLEFQDNQSILNLLDEDYRKMCLALMACFAQLANQQDNNIAMGVEAN